jgi:hypothetical protein
LVEASQKISLSINIGVQRNISSTAGRLNGGLRDTCTEPETHRGGMLYTVLAFFHDICAGTGGRATNLDLSEYVAHARGAVAVGDHLCE